jgi:hypothetical protein
MCGEYSPIVAQQKIRYNKKPLHGMWRSLVAHLVWDQRVVSSNLAIPIKMTNFRAEAVLYLQAKVRHRLRG